MIGHLKSLWTLNISTRILVVCCLTRVSWKQYYKNLPHIHRALAYYNPWRWVSTDTRKPLFLWSFSLQSRWPQTLIRPEFTDEDRLSFYFSRYLYRKLLLSFQNVAKHQQVEIVIINYEDFCSWTHLAGRSFSRRLNLRTHSSTWDRCSQLHRAWIWLSWGIASFCWDFPLL